MTVFDKQMLEIGRIGGTLVTAHFTVCCQRGNILHGFIILETFGNAVSPAKWIQKSLS